jgi:hypothetical protein
MQATLSPETLEGLAIFRDDPVAFGRFIMGVEVTTPDQERIAKAIAKRGAHVAVHSCHGSGKTFYAGRVIVPWFLICHAPCIVVTTAASARSVAGQLWEEVRAGLRSANIRSANNIVRHSAARMVDEPSPQQARAIDKILRLPK